MLCKDIYKKALRLIGETRPDEARTEDYLERAPYILANAVNDLSRLDIFYREALSLEPQKIKEGTELCLPLSETFPLSRRFVNVACAYLASLLIIDENPTLSDKIYDSFCVGVSAITEEIPAERQKILDRYS